MSTISAGTTTTTALVQTGDTTGNLVLQTGSTPTTAMTISSSQIVNFANAPTVAGAALPSGAMTLISTQTTTAGLSSLAFTGLSGYDKYLLLYSFVKPTVGGNGTLLFNIGTGATPTYITTGYSLAVSGNYYQSGNAAFSSSSQGQSHMIIGQFLINTINTYTAGSLIIEGILSGPVQTITGTYTDNDFVQSPPAIDNLVVSGAILNSTAVTALRITLSGDTFQAGGKFSLYGITS